jgi:integrase
MTHVIFKRAINQALQWGYLSKNPCEFIAKPKVPKKAIRYWDHNEIESFLDVTKENRLHALFVLAVTTGLRQGEIFASKWSDFNTDANTLSITKAAYELKGKVFIGEPKTQKSRRCIDLPKFTVAALEEHRAKMTIEGNSSDFIFSDTMGNVLRKSNFRKRCFLKLLKKSGLPTICFHDLRHSAATLLLTQGVHPKVVQERLGHSQISVTLDTYSHVLPTLQKEAAQKIDDFF